MITREDDVDAHALHRRGWTISAIARHLGHDRKTIRAYLHEGQIGPATALLSHVEASLLKEERLAGEEPRRLKRIKLDLTDRAARRQFLADMSAEATKVLVLTEGVAPYLTETDVAELADDLKAAEKVRYWIVDYYSPEAIRYGEKMRARFMRNAPFRFTPQD